MNRYLTFHVHKSAIQENDFKEHVNFYTGPAPSEDFVTLYTVPPSIEAAVLAEREACIKICGKGTDEPLSVTALKICLKERNRIANAIRARGER